MPELILFLQPVSNGLLEDPSEMATSSTPLLSEVFFSLMVSKELMKACQPRKNTFASFQNIVGRYYLGFYFFHIQK